MGTQPIFESDFDCLTERENCFGNGGPLQYLLADGASPVEVQRDRPRRPDQVGVDGPHSPRQLRQLHRPWRPSFPHCNLRKRVPSPGSVQPAEEDVPSVWSSTTEAKVDGHVALYVV